MPGDDRVILHHYDASPFSEKVRLMYGLKALDWASVLNPNMLPKPDLIPLTGGYRRAPVMQIGADIYCDSQTILAELERRAPGHDRGSAWAVNFWADRAFFQTSVGADALAIARDATPAPALPHDADDPQRLSPDAAVTVAADDYGRDPVAGTLASLSPERVTIARDTADLGKLHLHFPRAGYVVTAA